MNDAMLTGDQPIDDTRGRRWQRAKI